MTEEERKEIEGLLPFLANGSLEGEELARVEAAVAEDEQLAGELAALQALRLTMQAEDDVRGPGEFGHARLMRQVAAATPITPARRPILWQVAAAALLAVVLGQAWYLNRDRTDDFTLAGAEPALTVAFVPETSEEALRGLLLEAGLEIVAGPSALGIYELAPLEGVELEAAISLLEANPAIVERIDRLE